MLRLPYGLRFCIPSDPGAAAPGTTLELKNPDRFLAGRVAGGRAAMNQVLQASLDIPPSYLTVGDGVCHQWDPEHFLQKKRDAQKTYQNYGRIKKKIDLPV